MSASGISGVNLEYHVEISWSTWNIMYSGIIHTMDIFQPEIGTPGISCMLDMKC